MCSSLAHIICAYGLVNVQPLLLGSQTRFDVSQVHYIFLNFSQNFKRVIQNPLRLNGFKGLYFLHAINFLKLRDQQREESGRILITLLLVVFDL